MRRFFYSAVFLVMVIPALRPTVAQAPVTDAIAAKFPLTKATADRTDIVTAGSIMTLKKDNLLMFATDATDKAQPTYKDGKIQTSMKNKLETSCVFGHCQTQIVHRTFVAGEKFWLIDVQPASDGVVLQVLSDAINNVRYMASMKFPYPKGMTSFASTDQVTEQIGEVMNPEKSEDAPAKATAVIKEPATPPPPPAPAFTAIAPPPPPVDQAAVPPPTLDKGQTKEQVIAGFGQPLKIVKVGATKEIDIYKDMKVTYTNNKVTNVE